jgi:hypothetical protein
MLSLWETEAVWVLITPTSMTSDANFLDLRVRSLSSGTIDPQIKMLFEILPYRLPSIQTAAHKPLVAIVLGWKDLAKPFLLGTIEAGFWKIHWTVQVWEL